MSYITSDGEVEPVMTPVRIGAGIRRARFAPGGGRSDSITMEYPRPESAPTEDVHFDGGVVAMSPNTPGQRPERGHDPYFSWPETDYAMSEGYVQPFNGALAKRQPNYPMALNTRGYVNNQTGIRELPFYGLGGLGFDLTPAMSSIASGATSAAAKVPAKSSGTDDLLSVIKGIIPSITEAGKGVFTAYSEGRAAIKQAKMSMAGEGGDPMPSYLPPAKSSLPSWAIPAGAAALGLAILWRFLK